jgi:uncharacterized membrane protein YbaN (DUF454 family)
LTSILMQALGYAFLVLGVLGLFLPFLQGILFLVAGLLILSRYAPWAHRTLEWAKRQHPAIGRSVAEAEGLSHRTGRRLQGWYRRVLGRVG